MLLALLRAFFMPTVVDLPLQAGSRSFVVRCTPLERHAVLRDVHGRTLATWTDVDASHALAQGQAWLNGREGHELAHPVLDRWTLA